MVATKSKREILDYLWEWAENSDEWAKKLTKIAVGGLGRTKLTH